ncbi:MAG: hypothetical protein HUU48_11945 [Flavobacteriales bacterium]|nr:hypothetical protein [Flavobacteriales bacterium]
MKIFLFCTLFSVLLFSCKTETLHENETPLTPETSLEEENLQLNNGNKWKVTENMIVFIRNMETSVNEFENSENKDYSQLAQIIDKNIRDLTSNCTMEGQAHDELHKWLVPFIELSEKFDVATEPSEQEEIYKNFKAMFVEFNIYFE